MTLRFLFGALVMAALYIGTAQAASTAALPLDIGELSSTPRGFEGRLVEPGESFADELRFNVSSSVPVSVFLSAQTLAFDATVGESFTLLGFEPGSFIAQLYGVSSPVRSLIGAVPMGGALFDLAPGAYAITLSGRAMDGAQLGGLYVAMVAAPIPEPGTWALALVGLGTLWRAARRRAPVGGAAASPQPWGAGWSRRFLYGLACAVVTSLGLLGSAQAAAPSTLTFELGTLSPTFSSVTNRRVDAGQSFTDYVNFNVQASPLSSVLSALWVQDRYGFQPGSFTATLYDGASGSGRVVGLLEAGGDAFAQLAPGDYSVVLTGTALASPGFGASYTLALAANLAPPGGFDTSGPVAAIPEPQTWVLMLAGLGLLGLRARARL